PDDALAGLLGDQGTQRYPLHARVAQSRQEGKADFWNSVGGQYKASLDYVVTVSCESGTVLERGPAVRTQTIRIRDKDGPLTRMEEFHRVGGTVKNADGEPVENAWIVMHGVGWSASDEEGHFRFDILRTGTYHCLARGPDGAEAEVDVAVPGDKLELVLGAKRSSKTPAKKSS
ncbi:MAG: hypothetical protein QOK15_3347, partial [Nocardioidaceae bacterium]|nr:hypothetical protein [Nocardioidaceae bacterium]